MEHSKIPCVNPSIKWMSAEITKTIKYPSEFNALKDYISQAQAVYPAAAGYQLALLFQFVKFH